MNRQIYIHYGAKQFDPLLNFPIKNEHCWVKPKGGLWGVKNKCLFRLERLVCQRRIQRLQRRLLF